HQRQVNRGPNRPQQLQSAVLRGWLGRRRVDRANAEVIDVRVGGSDPRFLDEGDGNPDQRVGTDQPSRGGRRQIVLAEVDAISFEQGRYVSRVVHDEQGVVL